MFNFIPLYIVAAWLSLPVVAWQNDHCSTPIPAGQWIGETVKLAGGIRGHHDQVTISHQEGGTYIISDFSAGFLNTLDEGTAHPATIGLDCDDTVIASEVSTRFGALHIHGGTWEPMENTLTIRWELSDNGISEQSIFQLQP